MEFSLEQTLPDTEHSLRLHKTNAARVETVAAAAVGQAPTPCNGYLVPFLQMAQGQLIGSYMTGSVLGKGAYGTVYQALDMKRGGFVAIKQIDLKRIPKGDLDSTMVTTSSLIVCRWKLTYCETYITKISSAMWNISKLMNI